MYRLDGNAIYPGAAWRGYIEPGFFSVHSLRDVLRWTASMPIGTILFCSRSQAEIAVFAPGQFEFFLRECRRRDIRVIVSE
jgi:hypothetical protein